MGELRGGRGGDKERELPKSENLKTENAVDLILTSPREIEFYTLEAAVLKMYTNDE